MKNQYGSLPDEFITGTIGDEGHHEGSTEINTSKEDIERLYTFVSKVIVAAERHFERSIKLGEGNNIVLSAKKILYFMKTLSYFDICGFDCHPHVF